MVAVAVTSGTFDVPISLLVAVAMETFKLFSVTVQHTQTMHDTKLIAKLESIKYPINTPMY